MEKPKHSCGHPGCRNLISTGSRCSEHKPERPTAHAMGYDAKWSAYSKAFLAKHRWCADPYRRHTGELRRAVITGHKVAFKGDETLKLDPRNHVPLCLACNSAACALFEGGFGNPIPVTEGSGTKGQ